MYADFDDDDEEKMVAIFWVRQKKGISFKYLAQIKYIYIYIHTYMHIYSCARACVIFKKLFSTPKILSYLYNIVQLFAHGPKANQFQQQTFSRRIVNFLKFSLYR